MENQDFEGFSAIHFNFRWNTQILWLISHSLRWVLSRLKFSGYEIFQREVPTLVTHFFWWHKNHQKAFFWKKLELNFVLTQIFRFFKCLYMVQDRSRIDWSFPDAKISIGFWILSSASFWCGKQVDGFSCRSHNLQRRGLTLSSNNAPQVFCPRKPPQFRGKMI